MPANLAILVLAGVVAASAVSFNVPSTVPSAASKINSAQLSLSIEFFAFPGYTETETLSQCLRNLEQLRGIAPAIRIGGTTQDRGTYDPNLQAAVNYTVPDPSQAPATLTYGPSFFSLANDLRGNVTIGLNRQLNNIGNVRSAALVAQRTVTNLLAIELGNEPDLYSSSSPIVPSGQSWNPTTDAAVEKAWFGNLSASVGNIFQAAVYLSFPSWSTAGLIPKLGDNVVNVSTFSGHAYPQSACGGASTNLPSLMSHSGIVSFTHQFGTDAAAAHAVGKPYFLGETNSATCGGGGISPTIGAGLWVMDFVIQGALTGVDRSYFHHGTIGNCPYCFFNSTGVNAPYYGAYFVNKFFGNEIDNKVVMLDDGKTALGAYAVYSAKGEPLRALIYNSQYFDGAGQRPNMTIALSGINRSLRTLKLLRLSASDATARTDNSSSIAIGGHGTFASDCSPVGNQNLEAVVVSTGQANITVSASEAILAFLT